MLPKQLKDSQRHQRQPKQVELFLQSMKNYLGLPYLPVLSKGWPDMIIYQYVFWQKWSAHIRPSPVTITDMPFSIFPTQFWNSCLLYYLVLCMSPICLNNCCYPFRHAVTSGSEWVRTSENESGVSRDLASAYVLCLRTFVVPNLQRDEGKGLGK